MGKPKNSAARNAMSEMERQCYDWGWEDAEDQIIKLIDEYIENTDYPEVEWTLENVKDAIKGEQGE